MNYWINGEFGPALHEQPRSWVTFDQIAIPRYPKLVFATAIAPDCQDRSMGARFGIEIQGSSGTTTVFSRDKRPKVRLADRNWVEGLLDLSPWIGQSVLMTLLTDALDPNTTCAWALWRDLIIDPSPLPFPQGRRI